MKKYCWLVVGIIFGLVFTETEASAYLDPGTGSFFLQVIAASIVAVGFFARKFWGRITSFFGRSSVNSDDEKNL